MVGQTLGSALVQLLHSMRESRSGIKDNMADLMDYLDEEGYLDLSNQPVNALAMLQLAETYQIKELYTRAFAHCVGMSDQLFDFAEYQEISLKSKQLINQARTEMSVRVSHATKLLETFLDDDLSEANLGIPSSARAHLERFRSFLLSFYATKLGYYPPRSAERSKGTFDAGIVRTMRQDFEALYDLLVDDSYMNSQTMPAVAVGGICTVQLIQSFDDSHRYESLDHPLPLLPNLTDRIRPRRMTWIGGPDRSRPNNRVVAHAALMKAANLLKPGILENGLVRAYLRFEEQSVAPSRADKHEKVSIVDARKVRWILIYTVYQVLRSATDIPFEVEDDVDESLYHLSVSTANIPPWTGSRQMLRRRTDLAIDTSPSIIKEEEESELEDSRGRIEIEPDIDYFALTHKLPSPERCDSAKTAPECISASPSRSSSISRALSRSSTLRRSMRMFKAPSSPPPQMPTPPQKSSHHEIVVQGYGNGTNNANDEHSDFQAIHWNPTDLSIYHSSHFDEAAPELDHSGDTTPDSSVKTPSPTSDNIEFFFPMDAKPRRQKRRDVVSMVTRSMSVKSLSKRRSSNILHEESKKTESHSEPMPDTQRQSIFSPDGSLSRSFSRRSGLFTDLKRRSFYPENRPAPQAHEPNIDEEPCIMPEDADWTAMQAFMENQDYQAELTENDVKPAWEQYADLGGLTEMSRS